MALGAAARRYATEQRQAAKVASVEAKKPRSLVSEAGLSKPEPAQPVGMRPIVSNSGYREGYEKSVSGGRHHGTMLNIADSVGHSIAQAETDRAYSPKTIENAASHLGKAYTYLGMHHSAYLTGNHEAAAAHLDKAGAAIKASMGGVGGALKGGVVNAFGEKHRRVDLEKTITDTVMHYAKQHNVGTSAEVSAPKRQTLPEDLGGESGSGSGIKSSAAGSRLRDERLPSGVTHTIPSVNPTRSAAMERLQERGIGRIPTPTQKERVVKKAAAQAPDPETTEYHVHGAILGLASRKSIPLHHIDGLSDSQIDAVHKFVESKTAEQLAPHLRKAQKIVTKYQRKMYK